MSRMEWKFEPVGVTKDDPSHLGYFNDEALDDATSALVREDLQNRLDAHSGGTEPVLVRYYLPKSPLESINASKWFRGLAPHLSSPHTEAKIGKIGLDPAAPVPFCTIECFHTTGLVGDPEQRLDPTKSDGAQKFFWFIRNVGRSDKGKQGDRGKWGLGKVVYPASSKIRSFFSYSVPQDSLSPTLIGRSVLCMH